MLPIYKETMMRAIMEKETGENKKAETACRIKKLILTYLEDNLCKEEDVPLSVFISKELNRNYKYLSGVFSKYEGVSIEVFFIRNKTEKLKKMLVETNHSLKELTYSFGYSSPQHLSMQFKKITGLSPGEFRKTNSQINNIHCLSA
jgi:AraC family transcriptional regulator